MSFQVGRGCLPLILRGRGFRTRGGAFRSSSDPGEGTRAPGASWASLAPVALRGGADDVEVGPSLLSTPNFCPADAFGVARVINLAGEVGDNVVGERHAHEGPVFGQRS